MCEVYELYLLSLSIQTNDLEFYNRGSICQQSIYRSQYQSETMYTNLKE